MLTIDKTHREPRRPATRPRLAKGETLEYLDWLLDEHRTMVEADAKTHLAVAELAVRVHMGNAQAKTTQADLIRDGIMDAPST